MKTFLNLTIQKSRFYTFSYRTDVSIELGNTEDFVSEERFEFY